MSQTDWVLERRLMELTGLTTDQVKKRRPQWIEGRQWKWGPDRAIWYNLREINRWVESGRAA